MDAVGLPLKPKRVTKQTIVKAYGGGTTFSTTYVDVGSMTMSVPNGWYYVVQYGYLSAYGVSCHVRVLEGATVKQEIAFSQSTPIGYANNHIWKNTSGSTQTVKIQLKCDGGDGMTQFAILYYASGGASPNIPIQVLPFTQATLSNGAISAFRTELTVDISAYITDIDFASVIGSGSGADTTIISGIPIEGGDASTTITNSLPNKYFSKFDIRSSSGSIVWLVYDFSGVKMVA